MSDFGRARRDLHLMPVTYCGGTAYGRALRKRSSCEGCFTAGATCRCEHALIDFKGPIVYVLEAIGHPETALGSRMVKIGFTESSPRARMAQLRTGSPYRLRLLYAFHAGRSVETWLHDAFSMERSCREWFELDREQLSMLAAFDAAGWIDGPGHAGLLRRIADLCVDAAVIDALGIEDNSSLKHLDYVFGGQPAYPSDGGAS